eukprot:Opistho-2@15551
MSTATRRRVGIVGYGHLGKYLADAVLKRPDDLELVFVWNRTVDRMRGAVPAECILENLDEFESRTVDLIVEVAHPDITAEYGARFLHAADYMIGSPTALADIALESRLREAASCNSGAHGMYVPSGALWGGPDIRKMADRRTLKALKITMKKHPLSFKLEGDLGVKCDASAAVSGETLLYEGPVRALCPLAPNNVNTMAAAAVAAHNLGFDGVVGCLISDPSLESHIVEVDVVVPAPTRFRSVCELCAQIPLNQAPSLGMPHMHPSSVACCRHTDVAMACTFAEGLSGDFGRAVNVKMYLQLWRLCTL